MSFQVRFARKSSQQQFNFSHASLLKMLEAAGLPSTSTLGRKKGLTLLLTTTKGTALVVGDTHAVWESHQEDLTVRDLFGVVEVGQAFALDIASVEALTSAEGGGETVEVDL